MKAKTIPALLLSLALSLLCMHNVTYPTHNLSVNAEYLSEQDYALIAQNKDVALIYISDAVKNAVRQLCTTYVDLGQDVNLALFLDPEKHIAPYAIVRKDMRQLLQQLILADVKARDLQNNSFDIIQDYMFNLDTKKISFDSENRECDTRAGGLFNTNTGLAINAGGILNLYGGTNMTTSSTGETVNVSIISDPSFTGGITVTGGPITLNSGTNALNISNDAANTTVDIGTGAAAKTVNIGSTTGASAVTIDAGSGGIALNGTSAINISTDSTTATVKVGTGAAAKTVNLGSATGASAVAITAGSGGIALNGTSAINISTDTTTATVKVGTGIGAKTVTVGSTTGGSALTLQAGTGDTSIVGTATATTQAANDDSTKLATTAYADSSNPYLLLSTQTVSGAAAVQFVNLPPGYTSFQVKWYNVVPGTADSSLQLQFSTNNGSSYLTSSGYYGSNNFATSATLSSGNNATINGSALELSQVIYTTANYKCSGELNLTNIGTSTGVYPCVYGRVVCLLSTSPTISVSLNGGYVNTINCNAFQLIMVTAGVTISGTFNLYAVL